MATANRLSEDLCYRAVQSRDARFDGRFFTAVVTTGIYCRPICPAVTPQRQNVRFYACAAAAEEAGFRPCRRCRPDAAPETPAWFGTSASVRRGLRCIQEGALDAGTVDQLAGRLGLGERQLRRLFQEHLGASPAALARTRRAHFARQLLDQTELPVGEVACAAGFGSLRQFNEVMRATFACPPTELRRGARLARSSAPAAVPADGLILRLPIRFPYDWNSLLAFFTPRAIPGIEETTSGCYRRSFVVDQHPHRLEVVFDSASGHLLLRVQPVLTRGLIEVAGRIRALFDAEADPEPIMAHLRRDAELKPLVRERPGLRVPGAWDGFELGVRAILGQQISVAGATTLAGRLVREYGQPISVSGAEEMDAAGGITHLFPTAARLAEADPGKIGLPGSRARTLRTFAHEVAAGNLVLSPSAPLGETCERLLAIPGLGPWTAEYIAMRALRDPDAFPAGDLGLRRALSTSSILCSEKDLRARAEDWRPWRAYAAMYLWAGRPANESRRNHAGSS